MLKQLQRLMILFAVALLVISCSHPAQTPLNRSITISLPRLQWQPDGTPLPERDLHVADHWPPKLKSAIDRLLAVYPTQGSPLSMKDVEEKMKVDLSEDAIPISGPNVYKSYAVVSKGYVKTIHQPRVRVAGARYIIYRDRVSGGMMQSLELVISLAQTGFCMDPYELAVYTGSKFVNEDNSLPSDTRNGQPAYEWGMFERGDTGTYLGDGFRIVIADENSNRPHNRKDRINCVARINVGSVYVK